MAVDRAAADRAHRGSHPCAAGRACRAALKYVAIAVAIFFGVRRTQSTRRQRAEAERLGRAELVRRLVIALGAVEAVARERDAGVVGGPSRAAR